MVGSDRFYSSKVLIWLIVVKSIPVMRLIVVIKLIMLDLAKISNIFALIVVYLLLYYSLIVVFFKMKTPKSHLK